MGTRNDRENGQSGRHQYGIGSFEQQQWASEHDRDRSQSRDIQGRFSRSEDRRTSMFGRSRDEEEDRREQFGQRGDRDEHDRWAGRYSADRRPYRTDRGGSMSSDRPYPDDPYRDDRYRDDRYRADRDDDDDRSWFDRAKNNVRGWFHHDEDDDRDRRRFDDEDRRRFDRIRDDDQRRFDHDRDQGFSREEQRWFDHPERSWPGEDEPVEYGRRSQLQDDDDRQRELGMNDYSRQRGWLRDQGTERSSFGGIRDTSRHGDIRVRAEMRRADRERYGNLPEDRYYRDGLYRDDRDERHRFADTDDHPRRNWSAWSGRSDRDADDDRRTRLARDERSRFAPQSYDERHGHASIRGNRLDHDQQFASNTERGDDPRAARTRGRDDDQDRSFVPRDEYGRRRR
jgi:hypothetical protein